MGKRGEGWCKRVLEIALSGSQYPQRIKWGGTSEKCKREKEGGKKT